MFGLPPCLRRFAQFITAEEWHQELRVLVDEVCTVDTETVYTRMPEKERNEMAWTAWNKIEQVYGAGKLNLFLGAAKSRLLEVLVNDRRVASLLTPRNGAEFNTVDVSEGEVECGSPLATRLSAGLATSERRGWARAFRERINSYVYRKGDGQEPQSWPLIRKVLITGPWPVLSSGACLVDLPGVRDANAARANVAASYLQNCSCIWIVAPIKRAVDDGTAKELLGEQFKRRLLMDGQYGNVSFICTQTDDCEATEIMRDHEDVARRVGGRWEQMTGLDEALRQVQADEDELNQCRAEREAAVAARRRHAKAAKEGVKAEQTRLKEIEADVDASQEELSYLQGLRESGGVYELLDDATDASAIPFRVRLVLKRSKTGAMLKAKVRPTPDVDAMIPVEEASAAELADEAATAQVALAERKAVLEEMDAKRDDAEHSLAEWLESDYARGSLKVQQRREQLQKQLKPICAAVRNEYSSEKLQADFRAGLIDLCHGDDDSARSMDAAASASSNSAAETLLPRDFAMPVHCISANDFLKVTGIKPKSDGPPACFQDAKETNVPSLRAFVHTTTASLCKHAAHSMLSATSDFMNRLELSLGQKGDVSASSATACKEVFETIMTRLAAECDSHASALVRQLRQQVDMSLRPAVTQGASKGQAAAMSTVASWGSTDKRTKEKRNGGGLHYSTYNATVRRDGVYTSASAGSIDFNQELCDPVEKSFMVGWEATMNSATSKHLDECEAKLLESSNRAKALVERGFKERGIRKQDVKSASSAALRAVESVIRDAMSEARAFAKEQQRQINRQLLPEIQERMKKAYDTARGAERGSGVFNRMKHAVNSQASNAVDAMFDSATAEMLDSVGQLISSLQERITSVGAGLVRKFSEVFSMCWERVGDDLEMLAAREMVAGKLSLLRVRLDAVMEQMGCARQGQATPVPRNAETMVVD